jgi:hypothetical protein
MKIALTSVAAAALLTFAGSLNTAQAQVAYTNAVLNGCYAHQSSSVDTEAGAENRDIVGVLCFDGKGNIVGTSGTPGLSGHVSNTNGTVKTASDETGTYSVTNSPGDGMGTFQAGCSVHEFAIRNVDANGLAHGFAFILVKHTKACTGPEVIGGGAEYQGPLN